MNWLELIHFHFRLFFKGGPWPHSLILQTSRGPSPRKVREAPPLKGLNPASILSSEGFFRGAKKVVVLLHYPTVERSQSHGGLVQMIFRFQLGDFCYVPVLNFPYLSKYLVM